MPVVDPGWPAAGALPFLVRDTAGEECTGLVLAPHTDTMPAAVWAGPVPEAGLDPGMVTALADSTWHCALLPEHATGWFGRPGLSGHRLGGGPSPCTPGRWRCACPGWIRRACTASPT